MRLGMFFTIAATALLGASCSVQDFAPVALDEATFDASPRSLVTSNGYIDAVEGYGRYSIRYGLLSDNLFNPYDVVKVAQDYRGFRVYLENSVTYTWSSSSVVFDRVVLNSVDNATDYYNWTSTNGASFTWGATTGYYAFFFSDATYGFDAGLYYTDVLMLNKGSSALPFKPFSYGVSVEVPFSKVAHTFVLPLSSALLPDGQFDYNGFSDDGVLWYFRYGFVGGGAPESQKQTRIGITFVSEAERSIFLDRFLEVGLPNKVSVNFNYLNYELASVSNNGSCALYLYFKPVFYVHTLIESYFSFNLGDYDSGYQEGFQAAQDTLYGGIFKDARYVTLTYTKDGGAFASVDYDGFTEAFAAFKPYMFNGLLGVNEWLYNDRGGSLLPDWDETSDVGLIIQYTDVVSVTASPLYVDVEVFTDTPASGSCSTFTPRLSNGTTPMTLTFDRSFKGLVTDYYSYDSRYNVFKGYAFTFPAQAPICQTNYIGVLSNYAAGYLDGVNSRNAEIADLSQRIIDLQSDLSGYNGLSYDQIYELGRQAGINAGNAANSIMSGLFGAVLSVPLSIFGGLSEFSVLGVSVMSLIISLLVVAVAVMVLKRFL